MREKKPPRIGTEGQNFYVYFNDGRSQRKALRTTDLRIATERFQGWLDSYNNDTVVDDDPFVDQALHLWFEQWVKGRMASENRYHAIIKNLNKFFGHKRISEITRRHSVEYGLLRFAGEIGQNKAANGTVRRELQSLRACFTFLQKRVEPRERRISQKIIPYLELPPEGLPRERVFSQAELQTMRDFLQNHCDHNSLPRIIDFKTGKLTKSKSNRLSRLARFVNLAIETAQRKTSILELTWSRVNFENNIITFLPEGKAQTTKRRVPLPISSRLRTVLELAYEQRITDDVLDRKTSIDYDLLKMGQATQISGVTSHVFRHTWATHKAMQGVPIEKIAMFLGDTEKTVRKNYLHLTPDYLRDVVD